MILSVPHAAYHLAIAARRVREAECEYTILYQELFAEGTGLADAKTGDPIPAFSAAYRAALEGWKR